MNPDDNWQPPPCKHGVKPFIEQHMVPRGTAPIETYIPGRKEFRYDCPTPVECWLETWRQATEQ
jgi:hypothetical protein